MEFGAILSEEMAVEVAEELSAESEIMEVEGLEEEMDELGQNSPIEVCFQFSDILDLLFQDDFSDMEVVNVEGLDSSLEEVGFSIGTEEGVIALMESHPEKQQYFKETLSAVETMNNPEATPMEIRSAQSKMSNLKGQLLETSVKDHLTEKGFDVEATQRVVEGESGKTKPDIIATNNTESAIEAFGVSIEGGEQLSIECKCGGKGYMESQLNNHIPNQLSGLEGTRVLVTTSDIRDVSSGLAEQVCQKYDTKLAVVDVKVSQVENVIKEVAQK